MKAKFNGILTLLIALSVQFVFAQKTVSGTVSDVSGALPGASVMIKGTKTGTETDFDGKYSIQAKQGDVLVFSYVGLETVEKTVGTSNVIDVVLISDNTLDEVVIVGYGKTLKESFTGTATKIDSKNIESKVVGNVSQAIKGEVAGVNVITTSGAPGSDATIRIRGFGSVNGNRNPLYIVDGAPYASDISAINPSDISSMTILKDAAATSIYGSRGANGVIVITTKQGKVGSSLITFDAKTSINTLSLPNYSVIESPEEYIELSWSSLKNKAILLGQANPADWATQNLYGTTEGIVNKYNIWNTNGSQLIDPATGKFYPNVSRKYTPTKWSDAAFGTGIRQEANFQFSGGNEKTRFATSFGYLDDQGYTINSKYSRYTTRLNIEHELFKWLTVGTNLAATVGKYNNSSSDEGSAGSSGNVFALTNTTPAIYDIYLRDASGNLVPDPIFGGYQYDYGFDGRRAWTATNGIADAHYDVSKSNAITLLGNFNLNIDFTDWLEMDIRYSGQLNNSDYASRNNPYYGGWAEAGGYLYKSSANNVNNNFLQLLRFNKSYGNHNVEAFIAHESTENTYKLFDAAKTHAILPDTFDLNQYTTPYGTAGSYTQGWTLESYFTQLNYNFSQKYFITGSLRNDGSSRFYKNKWGTFGSVGLGWVISKENFLSDVKFLDHLKFKGSYGVIGDQGTNLQYGWQIFNINQTTDGSYSFTESSTLANPDLTWETSIITQVGLESEFFGRKLSVDIDYYIKNTKNLFFTQSLPGSSGSQFIDYNDGVLTNNGFEFDVFANLVEKENFRLSMGVNGEIFNNKITQMPNDYFTGEPKILDGTYSKDHSLYDWYMREWAGVDPATGAGLWNLYYNDNNNDGIFNTGDEPINSLTLYLNDNPNANVQRTVTNTYSQATQKYVEKSAIPKVRGGFRINTGFKNFDFVAQFSYSLGGYVYDNAYSVLMDNSSLIGGDNFHTDIRNAWTQPGDITNVPRMSAGYFTDTNWNSVSTRFLTKADYLSLNNVNLSYTLPKMYAEKIKMSKLVLFLTGDNLMMLSARNGLNPTTMVASSNSGIYMPMSTYSIGAKVEF